MCSTGLEREGTCSMSFCRAGSRGKKRPLRGSFCAQSSADRSQKCGRSRSPLRSLGLAVAEFWLQKCPALNTPSAFQAEGRGFDSRRAHSSAFLAVPGEAWCRARSSALPLICVPAPSGRFRGVPECRGHILVASDQTLAGAIRGSRRASPARRSRPRGRPRCRAHPASFRIK